MTDPIEATLKSVFGYSGFKPLQREVISNVLKKKDTLAIMPTGGGKSLCYQIPALLFEGLTIVVSPLISLMKDQVEQLQQAGIQAALLNSSLTLEEYNQNIEWVINRKVKLLYIAPESLLTDRIAAILSRVPVDCLTIDEAHCISEWGHDFRPEYRQLIDFRKRYPSAVCIALTATATPRVRADIKSSLGFEDSNEFIASFNRHNLFLEVVPKSDPTKQVLQFIQRFPKQSGIIYCFSRRQVDELAATLIRKGFSARPYHAGLENEERKTYQELFIRDDVQIIVATIAFGMGINKSNVRFVIHYDLPKSIESYYQEIGRAGRDGLLSHCLLLYSYGDSAKLRYFIDQKSDTEREVANQHLKAITAYAESTTCRRFPLLTYFGEKYVTDNCGMCDCCKSGPQTQIDITTPALKFLSCVARTGEIFGAGHVIDVLLGSDSQKVHKFDHQNLSTYGIGKDLARDQWMHLSRQLIQKGYLTQDDVHKSLKLTPKARSLFKQRETIMGILPQKVQTASARKAAKAVKSGISEDYNQDLFEILRIRRKQIADETHLPPYVIFSDRTLLEMASRLPVTVEQMRGIYGLGDFKLKKYGQEFAEMINRFCKQHDLEPPENEPTPQNETSNPRHLQVGELFNQGKTIPELMAQFDVTEGTITENLYRCTLGGFALRADIQFGDLVRVGPDLQERALRAFDELGTGYLRPVFDALDGAVVYDDLKVLRLQYLISKQQG